MSKNIILFVASAAFLIGSHYATYNKGYQHAEASMKAQIAEAKIESVKVARNIDEEVLNINSDMLDLELMRWYRD